MSPTSSPWEQAVSHTTGPGLLLSAAIKGSLRRERSEPVRIFLKVYLIFVSG
jgi:hypothetical protein